MSGGAQTCRSDGTRRLRAAAIVCCAFTSVAFAATLESVPLDITPEGVRELQRSGTPYQLVDANAPQNKTSDPFIHIVYYTRGLDSRAARERALRDRSPTPARKGAEKNKKKSVSVSEPRRPDSQRLAGTPLDWEQLSLPFPRSVVPTEPLLISPRSLADAINDGVDLQLIDLRPRRYPGVMPVPPDEIVAFPAALPLLPHEVEQAPLSKRRWVVLVDDGTRVAQPVAERLFAKGFKLVCVLEGGYPAWVAATDR